MIFIAEKREDNVTGLQRIKEFFDGAWIGVYSIKIDKWKKNRSNNQNNYYWMYLGIISDETGDNANDLHEFFKRKLLPPRFIKVLGKEVKLPATTTTLSKADFAKYLMSIEHLTVIPAPDTEKYL